MTLFLFLLNHNNNIIIIVLIFMTIMMMILIAPSSSAYVMSKNTRFSHLQKEMCRHRHRHRHRHRNQQHTTNNNNNNNIPFLLYYGVESTSSRMMMSYNGDDRDDDDENDNNDNDNDLLSISTLIQFDTIEELMLQYDPILLFASKLLPLDKAKDASALYAWCRRLDEIVDNNSNNSNNSNNKDIQNQLDIWKMRLDKLWDGQPVDGIDNELTNCIKRYSSSTKNNTNNNDNKNKNNIVLLTKQPFEDMISGMRSDIIIIDDDDVDVNQNQSRRIRRRIVNNLDELEVYAYRVAGTVGIMLLPLLEAPNEAKDPAICLGKAIQLINILRDANYDIKLGRIYLPQDLLQTHNVKESDIILQSKVVSKGYREAVKLVAIRAEELLKEAEIGGKKYLPGLMGPLFVQIIVELYRGYLIELEKRNYDNLTVYKGQEERVKISKLQKFIAVIKAIQKIYL